MSRLTLYLSIGTLVGCSGEAAPGTGSIPPPGAAGIVIYFHDPDCPDCLEVERLHLEPIAAAAACPLELVERVNVLEPAGTKRLLGIEAAKSCKTLAPILVVNGKVLCGIEAIRGARGSLSALEPRPNP